MSRRMKNKEKMLIIKKNYFFTFTLLMIRTVSVLQFVCLAEERGQQNTAAAAAGHRTVLSRPADSLS